MNNFEKHLVPRKIKSMNGTVHNDYNKHVVHVDSPGIITLIQNVRLMYHGSNPHEPKRCYLRSIQPGSGAHAAYCSKGVRVSFPRSIADSA
jgi:hypothetical protein